MKKIYLFAAVAALFAACSSDDLNVDKQQSQPMAENAVAFDAYAARGITRGGLTGDITNAAIQQSLANNGGFGVFGYYTDNRDYDQLAIPNFFYNQPVYYDGGLWKYEPLKYWPNEYGDNAVSDDNDKVSFFAYAPFVEVDAAGKYQVDATALSAANTALTTAEGELSSAESDLDAKTTALAIALANALSACSAANEAALIAGASGYADAALTAYNDYLSAKVDFDNAVAAVAAKKTAVRIAQANVNALNGTTGITGMTRNTTSGDPIIKWVGSFRSSEAVDLCWGVCQEPNWPLVNGGAQDFATKQGLPWLNIERPSQIDQRLKFQFKHALAKLQINVDEFKDATSLNGDVDANTRIWIRSVKFTGFSMKGALNLNNETKDKPYWMNYNGIGDLDPEADITVYDGMKDGKEAVQGATASNEKLTGLNPNFVEQDTDLDGTGWTSAASGRGVNGTTQPLFDDGGIFYVIPSDDDLTVEIVYDVETVDPNLGTKLADNKTSGSAIENRISKEIVFSGATINHLEAGKAYVINLHLGMNSVKLDANVANWEDVAPAEVDLPANVKFFAAEKPVVSAEATIPYYATSYLVGINGLNGGEAINVTAGNNKFNNATNKADENTNKFIDEDGDDTPEWSATNANANTSGYIVQTLTTTINKTTSNREQIVTWTGNTSMKGVKVTFTQQASPLALLSPGTLSTKNGFRLRRDITGAPNYGYFCTGLAGGCVDKSNVVNGGDGNPLIEVWRNGTVLGWVASSTTPAAGKFTFTDDGVLTFGEAAVKGDVIKVTLKTGDAPAETITWTVE